MTLTKGRVDRAGKVNFGDASLSILEEGRSSGVWAATQKWERQFKRDVFARIVQQLNRIGWECKQPAIDERDVKSYGGDVARWASERRRHCRKGDLLGELELSGRHIKFEMWQSVNTPTRPDHGGKYEPDKEAVMPYVRRLEMERTRRRIRDYLCNVFSGYEFVSETHDGRQAKRGFMHLTALEWIAECYRTSWHFKGDTAKYTISDGNRRAADGAMLEHGQRVWFFDRKGRVNTGTAYYNINNMWWVATGRYDVTNVAGFELYAACPDKPRVKRNADQRRRRLEAEMAAAVKVMDFERAAVLRDILFPGAPALYVVWHDGHQLYHRSGFRGYTPDMSQAGKFTADEVRGWDCAPNKVVALDAEKVAA